MPSCHLLRLYGGRDSYVLSSNSMRSSSSRCDLRCSVRPTLCTHADSSPTNIPSCVHQQDSQTSSLLTATLPPLDGNPDIVSPLLCNTNVDSFQPVYLLRQRISTKEMDEPGNFVGQKYQQTTENARYGPRYWVSARRWTMLGTSRQRSVVGGWRKGPM
jgi:hypothetical protein